MSTKLMLVGVLGVALLAASGQAALVAKYTFNNDTAGVAVDSSGSGMNGAVSGNPVYISGIGGGSNKAIQFDGINDMINYGNLLLADYPTEATVEGWCQIKGPGYAMYFGEDAEPVYSNSYLAGIKGSYDWYGYWGDNSNVTYCYPANWSTWYHVVSVLGGGKSTIYVNAAIDTTPGERPQTSAAYFNNSPHKDWTSGYCADTDTYGKFIADEFRLYDTALTPEQIMANYLAGPTVPEPCTLSLLAVGLGCLIRTRKSSQK
jgi:hypothetical protein